MKEPIYKPTLQGNTLRLFQLNVGLQGINSYLRGILTQDWIELDMQHAHLSIAATLWDIPELTQLLASGINVWDLIINDLNFPGSYPTLKSKLKSLMYSTLYGMSIANLKDEVASAFGEDSVDTFFNQSIISTLLKARGARSNLLTSKKYFTTYLGKEVKPQAYRDKDGFKSNLNSIISYEISEYEMLLLEPIFDLSMETQQFFITLYQYDGFTIDVRDKSRAPSILKKIDSIFNKRANELGIYTKLIVKS